MFCGVRFSSGKYYKSSPFFQPLPPSGPFLVSQTAPLSISYICCVMKISLAFIHCCSRTHLCGGPRGHQQLLLWLPVAQTDNWMDRGIAILSNLSIMPCLGTQLAKTKKSQQRISLEQPWSHPVRLGSCLAAWSICEILLFDPEQCPQEWWSKNTSVCEDNGLTNRLLYSTGSYGCSS